MPNFADWRKNSRIKGQYRYLQLIFSFICNVSVVEAFENIPKEEASMYLAYTMQQAEELQKKGSGKCGMCVKVWKRRQSLITS